MIGLIDCNNFYVSCERIFNPKLNNKPVVVLSNNDGCVIARSPEAKQIGIAMGVPIFKIKDLVYYHDVVVMSSNFSLYGDISQRIMRLLQKNCPCIEIYSIDEAFLDLSGIPDMKKFCTHIYQLILQGIGIPTSIGISTTKTLAKIANHIAKKSKTPIMHLSDQVDAYLCHFPIEDVWGIGKRMAPQLKNHHIYTAFDLKQADPVWMRRQFTVVGERLVHELNHISCLNMDDIVEPKKSIQVSRSFKVAVTDQDVLYQYLSLYTERLCEKLRAQHSYMKGFYVYIRSSPFKKPFIHTSDHFQFIHATHDPSYILKHIIKPWLLKNFIPLTAYKKAGVMAFHLQEQPPAKTLFDTVHNPRKEYLLKQIDCLNQKYGKGTIKLMSSMKKSYFTADSALRSPAYTTQWSDLKSVQ